MALFGAGSIYSVPFTASVTTAGSFDLLGVLAPNNSQVVLRSLTLGAVSSAGTQASQVEIDIFRGSTASSTSAAITPVQVLASTSPAPLVAGSVVTGPSSGLVSTASATLLHRDSWSYAYQSYVYPPNPSDFTFLARCDVSQRLHVRMSVPDKAITVAIQRDMGVPPEAPMARRPSSE